MSRSPDRDIRLLFPLPIATIASQSSMASVPPLFVGIGDQFNASIGTVGQVRSISAFSAVFTALMVGGWIHRHGARPVMIAGGLLAAAGALVSAVAPSLVVLGLGQAIVGIGIACLLSSGFAGAGEFFSPEARDWAIGWVVALQSLAWIIGVPLVGILADAFSWRAGFAVPIAFCLFAATSAMLFAPKMKKRPMAIDERAGLFEVLRDRNGRRWTIGELFAFGVWTAEITYIAAFYIETFDLSTAVVGILLPTGSLAFLIGSALTERTAARFSRRSILLVSSVGMGLTAAVIFNVHPAVGFTVAIGFVMGIFAGLRAASSSTLALDQIPDKPGAMMAARTFAVQIGYLVGAAAGGVVVDLAGYGALGAWMIIGMVASAWVMAKVPTKRAETSAVG